MLKYVIMIGKLKFTKDRRKLSFAITLIPIVLLAGLIFVKSVNVPYWDQWEFVPTIQHIKSGHFYFQDFWQQQNEHRLLFARLIMIGSALMTKWNIRVESLISFVIACGSFVILIKAVDATQKKLKYKFLFILPILLSLIWFSPVQDENWLWGWQIPWFLNVLGVVIAILAITRIKNKNLSYPNLLLLIGGATIALYSLSNGVLIWLILIAALLYERIPAKKTFIATITGVITSGLYYYHYKDPSSSADRALVLKEPVLFVKYLLTYLGRPLSFVHVLTPTLGFVLLIIFASLALYTLIKERTIFSGILPWVALGLYALGSAILTTIGRMNLGLNQAYSSRYSTISTLFLVAVIMMCIQCRPVFKSFLAKRLKPVTALATVLVFLLVMINFGWGVGNASQRNQFLRNGQQCTRAANPSDTCLAILYPYSNIIRQRITYLKHIHWAGY